METAVVNEAVSVTTGTLDYKKVAMIAGGILIIGVSAYATKKLIDKRKAKKESVTIVVDGSEAVPEIQVEPTK